MCFQWIFSFKLWAERLKYLACKHLWTYIFIPAILRTGTNRQKTTYTHACMYTPILLHPSRPDLFSRVHQHSVEARRLHRVCGMGTPQTWFSLALSPLRGTNFPVVLALQTTSSQSWKTRQILFYFPLTQDLDYSTRKSVAQSMHFYFRQCYSSPALPLF